MRLNLTLICLYVSISVSLSRLLVAYAACGSVFQSLSVRLWLAIVPKRKSVFLKLPGRLTYGAFISAYLCACMNMRYT